jgi:hypothetical protein
MEMNSGLNVFNIVAGSASILSLLFSLLALKQVHNIKTKISFDTHDGANKQTQKGNRNIQAGRDVNV